MSHELQVKKFLDDATPRLPETGDARNEYYASELDLMIEDLAPAICVHGHIHTACDYLAGSTRVICNPAGYDGRDHDPMVVI